MINKSYVIEGKVIDGNSYELLSGIEVSIITFGSNEGITIKSDKEGLYTLNITLLMDDKGEISERPSIYFNDPTKKYSETSIIPFTQDGKLLNNPSPVLMKLQKQDMEDAKIKFKQNASSAAIKATGTLPKKS